MTAIPPLPLPGVLSADPLTAAALSAEPRAFGAGGGEPWAAALRGSGRSLYLVRDDEAADDSAELEFGKWSAAPDAADCTTFDGLEGPVLDIGCGPGRMVRGALDAGLNAAGIDVSQAAVDMCVAAGLPVLHRSVFDRLPREGRWGAALLIDGNVGIGGDAPRLLARCRELLRPGGMLVVETHPDTDRDSTYLGTLVDGRGDQSETFPWTELGETPLLRLADAAGYSADASWTAAGRRFTRLRRP